MYRCGPGQPQSHRDLLTLSDLQVLGLKAWIMSILLHDVSVCVRERKKKRDRQTEVGGCACYASQADFELPTSRLPTPASGVSRTTGMHVTAPTPSLPLVKLALLVIFSPTLWPKHWEEQLSVIVLESSPQALVPLIQALGRGRGREGCSPHCGQGAENTEGTEDQAEPWKLCPPPPPPSALFPPGRSCLLRLPHVLK